MTVTNDEYLDIFIDTLIKIMIKNGYEMLSIDQLIEMKHAFKMNPLESLKN